MKKYLFAAAAIALLAGGCHKSSDKGCAVVTTTAPTTEVTMLKQFLDSAHITAVADSRGFYYNITDSGTGTKPSSCANVTLNYNGTYTNGTSFDANNNITFGLSTLITGWQEGVPLIAPGGSITLYLPPTLAYGAAGAPPTIPANAMLIFKIDLLSVD